MTCFLVSSARPLPPAPPTPSCTPPNAPNVHPVSNVPPPPPKETVGGRTTAFIPEKQRFGELEPARKKRSASKKPPDEGGRAPTDDGGGGGDRRSLNAQLSAEGGLSAEGRLSAEGGLSTEGGLYGWEPSSGLSQREWLRRVPRLERCCTQARFTHHSSLSPSVTERLFPMYHRHVSPPPPPNFAAHIRVRRWPCRWGGWRHKRRGGASHGKAGGRRRSHVFGSYICGGVCGVGGWDDGRFRSHLVPRGGHPGGGHPGGGYGLLAAV